MARLTKQEKDRKAEELHRAEEFLYYASENSKDAKAAIADGRLGDALELIVSAQENEARSQGIFFRYSREMPSRFVKRFDTIDGRISDVMDVLVDALDGGSIGR